MMDRDRIEDVGPPNPRQAEVDRTRDAAAKQAAATQATAKQATANPANPPRTTSGGITAPRFGSAGSGGAELEPGPEKN
jgi:hypothetical protein